MKIANSPGSSSEKGAIAVGALNAATLQVEYFPADDYANALDVAGNIDSSYLRSWIVEADSQTRSAGRDAPRAEVLITKADASDLEAISAIDRALWGAWANPLPLYRQLLDIFPSSILVARDIKGEPVGTVVALVCEDRAKGWILSVDVDSGHRGLGIGLALVSAAIVSLKERGCRQIVAAVSPENAPSLRLFQSLGFTATSFDPTYFGKEGGQLIMIADLPE